ncbi:MAG: ABC transporter ATP-binding protein [Acidobacteria bacterium]|nr:ABC transporter ATP-binding protein [Acidobacteriota bacterium]
MSDEVVLLQGVSLRKHYRRGVGRALIRAVDGVDVAIRVGECVALVGESGSGKTTLGRLLVRLIEPTAGRVFFERSDLNELGTAELLALRRRMQIVFQSPSRSLDPHMRVNAQVAEPLEVHFPELRREEIEGRVGAVMAEVGLTAAQMASYPHELSGGQQQRVAIARALVLSPELLVADEPASALDACTAAQIADLLERLQIERRLAILLITHDLRFAQRLSRRTAVMCRGRIVEEGLTAALCSDPAHPYTRLLLRGESSRAGASG